MTYSQKSGANRVILCRVVYHHQGARPDIFVIKSQEQILPQYVVKYEITGELGMTLEAGHFCMRELMPFQKLMSGYARLDDLLYREAESQVIMSMHIPLHVYSTFVRDQLLPNNFCITLLVSSDATC